jgi:hypothetical protein
VYIVYVYILTCAMVIEDVIEGTLTLRGIFFLVVFYVFVSGNIHKSKDLGTYIRIYIYIYIYIHTHTHMHAYIHTGTSVAEKLEIKGGKGHVWARECETLLRTSESLIYQVVLSECKDPTSADLVALVVPDFVQLRVSPQVCISMCVYVCVYRYMYCDFAVVVPDFVKLRVSSKTSFMYICMYVCMYVYVYI